MECCESGPWTIKTFSWVIYPRISSENLLVVPVSHFHPNLMLTGKDIVLEKPGTKLYSTLRVNLPENVRLFWLKRLSLLAQGIDYKSKKLNIIWL